MEKKPPTGGATSNVHFIDRRLAIVEYLHQRDLIFREQCTVKLFRVGADNDVRKSVEQLVRLAFRPILAGASLRERALACIGALTGISLTGLLCGAILGNGLHIPLIVAPIGASAVLLFAVPSSPLAQPWPIIGGNTISALVGVAIGRWISDPVVAIGLGVSAAIAVMSLTRSLHPPGGAAALTALIAGPSVDSLGYLFAFVPVCLNAVLLVALGTAFHRISGRRYPHTADAEPVSTHRTADPAPELRGGANLEDVDAALLALDETFDVDRKDLERMRCFQPTALRVGACE